MQSVQIRNCAIANAMVPLLIAQYSQPGPAPARQPVIIWLPCLRTIDCAGASLVLLCKQWSGILLKHHRKFKILRGSKSEISHFSVMLESQIPLSAEACSLIPSDPWITDQRICFNYVWEQICSVWPNTTDFDKSVVFYENVCHPHIRPILGPKGVCSQRPDGHQPIQVCRPLYKIGQV